MPMSPIEEEDEDDLDDAFDHDAPAARTASPQRKSAKVIAKEKRVQSGRKTAHQQAGVKKAQQIPGIPTWHTSFLGFKMSNLPSDGCSTSSAEERAQLRV